MDSTESQEKKEAPQKSIKKNSFYSFLNAFTTLLFPLATFPYASRILRPEGIGQVNFAVSIEGYFAMLAGLGISGYATREAAKLRDNRRALSKFCREMLFINLISMLAAYAALITAVFTVPKLYQYKILILVRSTAIFFTTVGMEWLYRAEEDFKYITLRSLIFKFSGLAFLFIFVKEQEDTVQYTVFGILTSVASGVCNLIHSKKYIDYRGKLQLELKKHFKSILTFFGMGVVTSLYTILDTSMLGFLSDDIQVGYYSAATRINKLVVGVLTATAGVLLPRLAYYIKNSEEKRFYALSEKSLSIMLLLSFPMTAGLLFLTKPLILLFSGNLFSEAVPAMRIISPVIIAMGMASITGSQILPSLGKEKISLLSYAVGATVNITSNAFFIPRLGATGAALGTLIAEFSVTAAQIIFLRSFFTRTVLISLAQGLLCCIPMCAALLGLSFLIKNSVALILLSIATGGSVYALGLHLVRNKFFAEYRILFMNRLRKSK